MLDVWSLFLEKQVPAKPLMWETTNQISNTVPYLYTYFSDMDMYHDMQI